MENLIEASESIHSRAFIAINTCAQEKSTLMLGVSMARGGFGGERVLQHSKLSAKINIYSAARESSLLSADLFIDSYVYIIYGARFERRTGCFYISSPRRD
jgi:hypothetical protein